MKAGDFLDAMHRMPMTTPAAFTGGAPIVVLSPHPDDESLGLGGLIAAARAEGSPVKIVVLTDGAASHPGSAGTPPARLAALRKQEALEAAAILGVPPADLTYLDLPDAAVPSSGQEFDAAVALVGSIVEEAGAPLLLVTWGHDPHCDHEAADAMARAVRERRPALAVWSYPIWGRHLDPATPIEAPAPEGFRLDIAPWLDRKHRAIAAHASQMTDLIGDDPAGFRFTPALLAPFLEPQEFVFAMPR